MLNNPTFEKLRSLRLTGMAEALEEQCRKPLPDLDFESRLGLLVEREWILRENRKLNGSYMQWLSQTAKLDLLILDDWGLVPLEDEQRRDLLEIIDDRYKQRSTIITGQLLTTHWHEYINDPTLADAILDRVLHNSIKIELKGDSLRKNKKTLQEENS
jgi:hypothetical protein